jgi:hypothetical protein
LEHTLPSGIYTNGVAADTLAVWPTRFATVLTSWQARAFNPLLLSSRPSPVKNHPDSENQPKEVQKELAMAGRGKETKTEDGMFSSERARQRD